MRFREFAAAMAVVLAAQAAFALEFLPKGNIGIGGAGVARTFDGTAAYWNPGALAFEAEKVSIKVGGGAGYRIDDNLAGNVDRLSRLGDPLSGDFDLAGTPSADRAGMGQLAQLLAVLGDIRQEGSESLRLNGDLYVGIRAGHFGTGLFGSLSGAGTPNTDIFNIRPTGIATPGDLATAIGATFTGTPTFFSPSQFAAIAGAFGGGATGNNIAYAFDQQLSSSNAAGVTPGSATTALIRLGNSIAPGSTAGNVTANQSNIETRGIAYFEIPLAYGFPVDLGRFGTLGLGAAVKAMGGRVYISNVGLFNTTSSDIFRKITKDHEDSYTWGVDVGALWKYRSVNLGVVAKNLNTPKFSTSGLATAEDGFRIRPQVRAGGAVDLTGWLSVAGDIDLTRNETARGDSMSRNLGGGLDIHPLEWLKLRIGAIKNITDASSSPIATAGLTLGPQWFSMDLDAAMATENTDYKGHGYPREAAVQLSLNSRF